MSMLDTPIVIRDLTVDERIALAQEIWDSILDADGDEGWLDLSDEQRAEIERRYDAYKANPDDVVLWEDVKKRLMAARK